MTDFNKLNTKSEYQLKIEEREMQSTRGALCIYSVISFLGVFVTVLIFTLDYYPLTQITMHNGYCTNMVESVYSVKTHKDTNTGIYYYYADVYDDINGTYIGRTNGCYGTEDNSYIVSAGIWSDNTDRYPYSGFKGNIPAWLCSHLDEGSELWKNILDEETDDASWTPWANSDTTWTACKYGSLKDAQKSPWNVQGVANVGNNDWMSVIPLYGSTYTSLNNTDHYYTTLVFLTLFGVIFLGTFICSTTDCGVKRCMNDSSNY